MPSFHNDSTYQESVTFEFLITPILKTWNYVENQIISEGDVISLLKQYLINPKYQETV